MPEPKAPTTPPYAPKLNTWHDKEIQKQNITKDQLLLQDQIATEMNLQPGETRNVTHRSIGYGVTQMTRFTETGEVNSCTITYRDIHEEIA